MRHTTSAHVADLLQQLRLQGCVCSERYGYNDESGQNDSSTLLASSEGDNDEMTSGDDNDATIDEFLNKMGGNGETYIGIGGEGGGF